MGVWNDDNYTIQIGNCTFQTSTPDRASKLCYIVIR